jgi:hypothetical protein
MKEFLHTFAVRFFYLTVFIPAGIFNRVSGRDPLKLKFKRGAGTGSVLEDVSPDSETFKKVRALVERAGAASKSDATAPDTIYPMW